LPLDITAELAQTVAVDPRGSEAITSARNLLAKKPMAKNPAAVVAAELKVVKLGS
jgi:hypothetical protein